MRAIKEIIRRSASRKNTGRTTKRARPPVVPKPGGCSCAREDCACSKLCARHPRQKTRRFKCVMRPGIVVLGQRTCHRAAEQSDALPPAHAVGLPQAQRATQGAAGPRDTPELF